MNIKKWIGRVNRINERSNERGELNMEMVKQELRETKFVKADTKNVLNAIKKCNKKYDKAMRNLAK